jgi:hypothetical protein
LMTRMWLRKSRFSKSSRKSAPGMGGNGTDTLPLEQHRVYTPSPVASRCQYRAPQCGHTHSIQPQSCAESPSLTAPSDPPGTKNDITPRRSAPVVCEPTPQGGGQWAKTPPSHHVVVLAGTRKAQAVSLPHPTALEAPRGPAPAGGWTRGLGGGRRPKLALRRRVTYPRREPGLTPPARIAVGVSFTRR